MTTDDDDGLTDDQILDLPMQVMPGDLSRLWSARANSRPFHTLGIPAKLNAHSERNPNGIPG